MTIAWLCYFGVLSSVLFLAWWLIETISEEIEYYRSQDKTWIDAAYEWYSHQKKN